jgi:hypothetical protein
MAEHTSSSQAKTLEMRVAELEDKLSKLNVTEDEMKAYQKVSALMGPQAPTPSPIPQICVINRCISTVCITTVCSCIRPACIYECTCGPCNSCILQSKQPGGDFGGFGS